MEIQLLLMTLQQMASSASSKAIEASSDNKNQSFAENLQSCEHYFLFVDIARTSDTVMGTVDATE